MRYLNYSDVRIKPRKSSIASRSHVDLINGSKFVPNTNGIVLANMDSVGTMCLARELFQYGIMTCLHKHYSVEEWVEFFNQLDGYQRKLVWYSLGSTDVDLQKLARVALDNKTWIPNIAIDVANGYCPVVPETIKEVRKIVGHAPKLMVGNVATPDIIEDYYHMGVDIVKVGIGPGSHCQTKNVAAVHIPQFTAVQTCSYEAKKYGIEVCADGGCKSPADVALSFAAGAKFSMLGGMFAGHEECVEAEWEYETDVNWDDMHRPVRGKKKKSMLFYGMSSKEAMKRHGGGVAEYRASEGSCTKVPYKGSIHDTVRQILGGLRSACSYTDSPTLAKLHENSEFITIG